MRTIILWLLLTVMLFGLSIVGGALAGYQAGEQTRLASLTQSAAAGIDEQYQLALQDLAEKRYEIAYQRFEWVLNQNPSYPGVPEKMAEVMAVLFATATPTPVPPTITPTPTRDLRPVQDLFSSGQALLAAQDWSGAIDTLIALRKEDPAYQTVQVDGMLYIALRQRGVHKILEESNLQGGIYDLTLAENFGPLDGAAESAREWARIFVIGNSFWEANPVQAVYYFSQVAAGAPYMRDAAGWTAKERYRGALIQLGNRLLADDDPCAAQVQFELAQSIRSDNDVYDLVLLATELCTPPTEIPTETQTPTWTPTWTPTLDLWTPSPTFELPPTETFAPEPTAIVPPTETATPEPPTEPAPTEPAPPTEAPPATTEPPPAETPTPEVTQPPVEGSPTP